MPAKKTTTSKDPEVDFAQVGKEIFDKMKLRPNNTNGKGDKSINPYGWADACFTPAFLTIMTASIGQADAEWNRFEGKAWKINHEESKVRTAVNLLLMKEIEKQGVGKAPVTGMLANALNVKFHNTKSSPDADHNNDWSDDGKEPEVQPGESPEPEKPKEPMPKVDISAMKEALASQHPLFAAAKSSTPPVVAKSNHVETGKTNKFADMPPLPPIPPPTTTTLMGVAGAMAGAVGGALYSGVTMAFGGGNTHNVPSTSTNADDAASVHAPTNVIDVTEDNHVLDSRQPTTVMQWGVTHAPMPSLHETVSTPIPDAGGAVGKYSFGLDRRTKTVVDPAPSAPPAFNPSVSAALLPPVNTREVQDLKAQLARAEKHCNALEERNNDLDKHAKDQDDEIIRLRDQVQQTTDGWNAEMLVVTAKDKEIERLNNHRLAVENWGNDLQAKVTALESTKSIDKQVQDWMDECKKIQRLHDEVNQERLQLEADLDTVQKSATQQLSDKDKEIVRLNNLLSSTHGKADLARAQQEVARLQKELGTLKSTPPPSTTKLQNELDSAQTNLRTALNTVSELNGRVQQKDKTIAKLQAELDTLKASPAPQAPAPRQASGASFATTASSVISSPEYQVLWKKWEAAEKLVGQLQAQIQTRVGGLTPTQQARVDARLASRQPSSSTPSPFTYRR